MYYTLYNVTPNKEDKMDRLCYWYSILHYMKQIKDSLVEGVFTPIHVILEPRNCINDIETHLKQNDFNYLAVI